MTATPDYLKTGTVPVDVVRGVVDPVTGGVSLLLNGESYGLAKFQTKNRPLSVIPLGDSITQANAAFSSGLWNFGSGYAEQSIAKSGSRFSILRNAGIAGNTTAQMLARLQADVIAYSPDICLFMGGTNDFSSGMSNAAIASMFNNIEQIVLRLLAAGILPVIVTPPPKNAAATESKNTQWFYYALAKFYGLPLVDVYRYLVNPSTGAYQAAYTSDGTHPIAAGVTAMISVTSAVMSNLDVAYCPPYLAAVSETSANTFSNLLRNGAFAISGTPPTPDSWSINTTNAVQTIPAATLPYTGNTSNYNKSVAGAVYALSGTPASIAGSGYAVGDVLQMNVRVNVSGLTPASASGFNLGIDSGGGGQLRTTGWNQNGDFVLSTNLTVPSGATTLTPTLYVVDAGIYQVNNWTLFNVTKANAIWQPGLQ